MTARDVARQVLGRVEGRGEFASVALSAAFERARLDPRDRGLATELVYGVLRHKTRLDRALVAATAKGALHARPRLRTILRVAAYQILFLDRVPAHAAVDDAVEAAKALDGDKQSGFANGLLRKLVSQGEPPLPDPEAAPLEYAEVAYSLPRWLVKRLPRKQVVEAARGLCEPAPLAVRVNALKATVEQVVEALGADVVERVPALDEALWVTGLGDPAAVPSFRDGWWTVQDVASQRVAHLVAPQPGETILDACAGVGGKSAHMAALTGDAAFIDAADASATKLERLREHATRLGVQSVRPIQADLTDPDAPLAEAYDAVLVDAPCTGLGVLRRHPEAKWRVARKDPIKHARVQAQLLDALATRVRPGGRLVYAVCTFTAEETNQLVGDFVARNPAFTLEQELRTWPHVDGADAFYAARLRRPA